jgi:tetrachlorobenzoquinone reductase
LLFSSGRSEPSAPSATDDQSFIIELAHSKLMLVIPSNRSILSVLAEHGLTVPSVCKEGWCGTCRTRVLAGRVEHRDDILEEEVKATNTIMQICVSRALSGDRLVLDL